jgi:pyruvate/2-oxoacid:ferredoxin oxidoreductase beta subunit
MDFGGMTMAPKQKELTALTEKFRQGHYACPGCGVAIAMRLVLKALGEKTIVAVVPSCSGVISMAYPFTALGVPNFHTAFEIGAPTAGGISHAMKIRGKEDINVVTFAGDGGTFDIGLQSLSASCDRNENFIYVCLDNEAYMNTGIQSSSATPADAWTMTTPTGRQKSKKKFMEIIAAHRIPYAATASVGFPRDLMNKVLKAKDIQGTRFLHILTPCPTGWRMGEGETAIASMLSVETRLFPLYEIVDGVNYTITHDPQGLPVSRYLKMQGRYRHMSDDDMARVQQEIDVEWTRLMARVSLSCSS